MSFGPKQCMRALAASALIPLFVTPPNVFAQAPDHIVSSSDMQKAAADAAQTRQQNIDTLNQFFSSQKAEQALKASHVDPQQVRSAIPTLNDQELAQLAQRAQTAQEKFAAGNLSDHDLLIILVAVAVLVLIIVAVR